MPQRRHDGGFTLIELMVVVLIIAILLGLAIIAFGRFQTRGEDANAQTDLRHVLLAEQAAYQSDGAYSDDQAVLRTFEPEITVNLVDASQAGVFVDKFSDTVVCFQQLGGSGKVLGIWLRSNAAPQYGEFADQAAATAFVCNGTAPGWPTVGWT